MLQNLLIPLSPQREMCCIYNNYCVIIIIIVSLYVKIKIISVLVRTQAFVLKGTCCSHFDIVFSSYFQYYLTVLEQATQYERNLKTALLVQRAAEKETFLIGSQKFLSTQRWMNRGKSFKNTES